MLLDILNILLKLSINVDYVLWLDCDELIGNKNIELTRKKYY